MDNPVRVWFTDRIVRSTFLGSDIHNVWINIDGSLVEFEEWTPNRRVWVPGWTKPHILAPTRRSVIFEEIVQ